MMRNYLLSFLCVLLFASACKNTSEKAPLKENEDFDRFLEQFSIDTAFQLQRVSDKFLDCTVTLEADSSCEKIPKNKWHHLSLKEDHTIVIHSSFNLKDTSSERLLELDRDESAGANLYFFKRSNGEWFLIRRLTYED